MSRFYATTQRVLVHVTQQEACMAFEAACRIGNVDIIKYLITYLTNQCSEYASSFLFTSCVHGHLDIVKFLIDECNCDPHADDEGLTPLHMHGACTDTKHLVITRYNLASKTSSDVTNMKEQGVLSNIWVAISYLFNFISQFVSRFKDIAIVQCEQTFEIDDFPRTKHDSTSQLSLKSYKLDIFEYLVVRQKCNTQCKDKDGLTSTPLCMYKRSAQYCAVYTPGKAQ